LPIFCSDCIIIPAFSVSPSRTHHPNLAVIIHSDRTTAPHYHHLTIVLITNMLLCRRCLCKTSSFAQQHLISRTCMHKTPTSPDVVHPHRTIISISPTTLPNSRQHEQEIKES
jgi:hypothetical protein